MNIILSESQDPYFNLATEEYLLKNSDLNFVFLYINRPCVVVGKHQISQKETNSTYIYNHKILVARRLSGGGAVYQDKGNLNISFIRNHTSNDNMSYKNISESLYSYLKALLPDLILTERNDFYLKEKKVSGSAMHVFKNRILAHCTLLINSDLLTLSASLHGDPTKFNDKSISSRRVSVMNISDYRPNLTLQGITNGYIQYLKRTNVANENSHILSEKWEFINNLALTKYATFDWIFGYSPKYMYQNIVIIENKPFEYEFQVEKGIIEKVNLRFDQKENPELFNLLTLLAGSKHNIYSIIETGYFSDSSPISKVLFQSIFSCS